MKINIVLAIFFIGVVAFLATSSSGGRATSAASGNTGAPNEATTCVNCHIGGSFNSSAVLQIFEKGTNTPAVNYVPNVTYDLKFTVNTTSGTPAGYGFQMVALRTTNNANAGQWLNPSANAQIASVGSRSYVEHGVDGSFSPSNVFTTEWKAPATGSGAVRFYAAGNAVNGTGTTGGDKGTAPINLTINELVVSTVSVSASPANGGTVTGGGTYTNGQQVTVSATANAGYVFVGWKSNGAVVSTDANYTFTVSTNVSLEANFVILPTLAVTAVPMSINSALFGYVAMPNATKYQLRLRESNNGAAFKLYNLPITTTYKVITGLTVGKTYDYSIRWYDNNGTISNWTPIKSFVLPNTNTSCQNPTDAWVLIKKAGSAKIWWGFLPAATSYRLRYRQLGATAWTTTPPTINNKVLSGLADTTTYEYQVRCECNGSFSPYSSSFSFTTLPAATTPKASLLNSDVVDAFYTENDENYSLGLAIYPNPTTNFLNVSLKNIETVSDLSIIDGLGRVLQIIPVYEDNIQVSTDYLPSGVYRVVVRKTEGSRISKMFIKE